MYKNLSTNQLILIALSALLLLLAAAAFYLLQDPTAPLPFSPVPATATFTASAPAQSATALPPTLTPTPRTSYTPFATHQTPASTPSPITTGRSTPPTAFTATSQSPVPSGTLQPTSSTPSTPVATSSTPGLTPSPTVSTSPTTTVTFSPGEVQVTGRIVQNATPVANVLVRFADDAAPRQGTTIQGGHYSFTTLAPGTSFKLTFEQADNPSLAPATEVTSLALIEGNLPTGVNPIDLPDLEISINLNGLLFEPETPLNGSSYPASVINAANPVQFIWALYSQGGSYHIELGPTGSDEPIWTSNVIYTNNFMWDGTLSDGMHITQGTYWWRVSATKSLGNYIAVIFTQQFNISFTQ